MKRKHKIEFIIVSIIILASSAFLVYQFRFNHKFLYERGRLLCEQSQYDKAIACYVDLLEGRRKGKYVEDARRELFCKALPKKLTSLVNPSTGAEIDIGGSATLEKVVNLSIDALKDKNSVVRWRAAETLGRIGDARAAAPLIVALRDESPGARSIAAWALGRIKDQHALAPLVDRLEDEDWLVRLHAAWALKKITGKDFGQAPEKWRGWWDQNKRS